MVRSERKRSTRVRETAHADAPAAAPSAYSITMADRGRLVLPSDVRERLNIKEGDRLTLILEADGSLRLLTPDAYVTRLRGAFKHLAPGHHLVDELLADRRREAAIEDRKDQQFGARRRLKSHR